MINTVIGKFSFKFSSKNSNLVKIKFEHTGYFKKKKSFSQGYEN